MLLLKKEQHLEMVLMKKRQYEIMLDERQKLVEEKRKM